MEFGWGIFVVENVAVKTSAYAVIFCFGNWDKFLTELLSGFETKNIHIKNEKAKELCYNTI